MWLFVFENHSYSSIIGNPEAPYLNGLARRYGLATRLFAVAHPSLPNYLAMIGGSTFGCTSDACTPGVPGATLIGQLEARGLTWAGYFEDLPHRGYTGGDANGYVQHHDPFVYFSEIRDTGWRSGVAPLGGFRASLRRPAAFTFVEGTDGDNMHSGSIGAGDAFAARYVGAVLASAAFRDHGLVLITWDEGFGSDTLGCCGTGVHGGHVPLIVAASDGVRGIASAVPHDTYSILRTIEDGFGLAHLRHAGDRSTVPLGEFWP